MSISQDHYLGILNFPSQVCLNYLVWDNPKRKRHRAPCVAQTKLEPLCSLKCPWNYNPSASTSWVLGLQDYTTTPSSRKLVRNIRKKNDDNSTHSSPSWRAKIPHPLQIYLHMHKDPVSLKKDLHHMIKPLTKLASDSYQL
jgi:hypothetical protein